MSMTRVNISRFNPDTDTTPRLQEYNITGEERKSVLQALIHIYEEIDPTLAFRFGCRFNRCGLCSMQIDGKPRLACLTEVGEGMVLEPLSHLPVLRDLVIDRSLFYDCLKSLQLYIPFDDNATVPQTILEPKEHKSLISCFECLACLAGCPYYDYRDKSFGGPYLFVKLAILHSDPRDNVDRVAQARALGVERCRQCDKCHLYCPMGISIYKDAIEPFLR